MRSGAWFLTGLVTVGLLCGCATSQDISCPVVNPVRGSAVSDHDKRKVQALERRVKEQDREITALRIPLETIKQIDMDMSANNTRELTAQDPLR